MAKQTHKMGLQFGTETEARGFLESVRWPDGPACPHCGSDRAHALNGKKCREGLYKCGECRKQYTVTVGTLFERSKIPLHKWLTATYLLCSSKKGVSSKQLERTLHVTYKTAWFMSHRIREAMSDPVFTAKLGGQGCIVEADETYWGNKGKQRKGARGFAHKEKIFGLVERGGDVRSFHVSSVAAKTLKPIMREQIDSGSHVVTDEMGAYKGLDAEFAGHDTVNHTAGEYVRGPIYTNTIENYFSILKRGLTGIYQHVSANHLRRYIGEFDFRYNSRKLTDIERMIVALRGITGKRLTFREPLQARA